MLILMFIVMFVMCLMVVMKSNTLYARILSAGCTALIFVEFLMNLSVELQIIPSTGVTLPFFSYGGTAQVMLLVAMGFILCVSRSTIPVDDREEKMIEEEIEPEAVQPAVAAAAPSMPKGNTSKIPSKGRRPDPRTSGKKIRR